MAEDFDEYDVGFRLGTFDRCNGRDFPRVEEDGSIFAGGYYDAWASNDNQIGTETDDERADRLGEEAWKAGEALAAEINPQVKAAANKLGDFSDSFWDGFLDKL